MHSKDQPVYPMRVATELTGLTERQIRYYDTMGLVTPRRTAGGHRLYSQHDIERLNMVARLIAKGLTVEQVAKRLNEEDQKRQRVSDISDASFRMMRPHPSYGAGLPVGNRVDRMDENLRMRPRQGEWKSR